MDGLTENTLNGSAVNAIVAFVPVCLFLMVLTWMDGYKLVRMSMLGLAVLVGGAAAGVSYLTNNGLTSWSGVGIAEYVHYGAPVIEEILKSMYIVALTRMARVAFTVDAAIVGFAVGTGFGLIENFYYYSHLGEHQIYLWLIRGFGTAIMHGSTTAIFAMLYRTTHDVQTRFAFTISIAGPVAVHMAYNHFLLGPTVNAIMILAGFPLLVVVAFTRCRSHIEHWLGIGFDRDAELLTMLDSGHMSDTPIGRYLSSIKTHFPSEIVVDMICLVRLHAELSLRAKGILLMRSVGLQPPSDHDVRPRLVEMRSLTKNIGKIGRLALSPVLSQRYREVWQLRLLE
jgi:RsiW-degrading membrane proteinase PrsW (M82 family)